MNEPLIVYCYFGAATLALASNDPTPDQYDVASSPGKRISTVHASLPLQHGANVLAEIPIARTPNRRIRAFGEVSDGTETGGIKRRHHQGSCSISYRRHLDKATRNRSPRGVSRFSKVEPMVPKAHGSQYGSLPTTTKQYVAQLWPYGYMER